VRSLRTCAIPEHLTGVFTTCMLCCVMLCYLCIPHSSEHCSGSQMHGRHRSDTVLHCLIDAETQAQTSALLFSACSSLCHSPCGAPQSRHVAASHPSSLPLLLLMMMTAEIHQLTGSWNCLSSCTLMSGRGSKKTHRGDDRDVLTSTSSSS